LIIAEGEVWSSGDDQAFRAVFTEDAIFTDKTFGDLAVGIDAIEAFSANLAMGMPSWTGQATDRYIGLEGGITVNNIWNLELGGHKFTQDDPLVEVDRACCNPEIVVCWALPSAIPILPTLKCISTALHAHAVPTMPHLKLVGAPVILLVLLAGVPRAVDVPIFRSPVKIICGKASTASPMPRCSAPSARCRSSAAATRGSSP
jgi:hypothetical protein